MTAQSQLWVYNSEKRFVGSFYHNTCGVKRANRFFENNLFWDTLMTILIMIIVINHSDHHHHHDHLDQPDIDSIAGDRGMVVVEGARPG